MTAVSTSHSPRYTQPRPWQSLIAGAMAGAVEISLTYPTEYAKTQLQLPHTPYTSPIQVLRHTMHTKGIRGIYVGLSPMVAGTAAKASIRFLTYDTTCEQIRQISWFPSHLVPIMAGFVAGIAEAVLIVTPSEVIKTRMVAATITTTVTSTSPTHLPSVYSTITSLTPSDLWRGVVPVALRQAANSAVRFGSYSWLKTNLAPGNDHPMYTFIRGAIAGIITVYSTMPLDVAKTKMQAPLSSSQTLRLSLRQCLVKTVNEGGPTALWKGATPRLTRLVFSGAIVFTVYEEVIRAFKWIEQS